MLCAERLLYSLKLKQFLRMAKRTKEQIAAAHTRCRTAILDSVRNGISKVKDMPLPADVTTLDMRNVADQLAESGVLLKVGKRNATYTLVDDVELDTPVVDKPLSTEGMSDIEVKFEQMIRSMPRGAIGKVQAESPSAIVRRFAEKHDVPMNDVDALLSAAVRDGRLTYESRFQDGYRIFVWRV